MPAGAGSTDSRVPRTSDCAITGATHEIVLADVLEAVRCLLYILSLQRIFLLYCANTAKCPSIFAWSRRIRWASCHSSVVRRS